MKLSTYLTYILVFVLAGVLSSCRDEDLLRPEGASDGFTRMTVSYFPDVTTEVGSRTAGNAIESVKSLQLVVFHQDGYLFKIYNQGDLENLNLNLTHQDAPSLSEEDTANGGSWTQGTQSRATFRLSTLPRGAFKIYALANCAVSEADLTNHPDGVTDEEVFRNTSFTWNAKSIASNDQMCGYFTTQADSSQDKPLAGLEAPVVVVGDRGANLHCWLKRLASKVTVDFDGSELHQNVNIYIRKVTVKDIPRTCALAAENSPQCGIDDRASQLLLDGESIYYNKNGETDKDPGAFSAVTPNWMRISNGEGKKGSRHTATSNALFFYENCQGDYKDHPERERYNKEPKAGWVHEYLDRTDEDWEKRPWDYDTKDKVAAGTYVEVEGYYESFNDRNVTSGPIKYRFMLGKNTTYNYNAQRNHHYKLTLKFKGWANQPEWHIEYVEDKPDAYIPPEFFMPYVYNHRVEMPVRWIGDIEYIKFQIVENDWAPHNKDEIKSLPPQGSTVSGHSNEFVWNREAWVKHNGMNPDEGSSGGKEKYYLGFLALALEKDPESSILQNYSFDQKEEALEALDNDYTTSQRGRRRQDLRTVDASGLTKGWHGYPSSADQSDYYEVIEEANSHTMLLPLFTRAMSMIVNSGFTGNNPYQYHYRYAKLKVTFKFMGIDNPLIRYSDIWQVPRITNPKGVFYRAGLAQEFQINLMERAGPEIDADFRQLESSGSWSAAIQAGNNPSNFEIMLAPGSSATMRNDTIIGRSNTPVQLVVKFKGGASGTALLRIKYHAERCVHEVFLRQGFEDVQLTRNGAVWSSFNLLHGGNGTPTSTDTSTGATLVDNPLSIGSYFKRKNLQEGILEKNNETFGHLANINYNANTKYKLALSNNTKKYWCNIDRCALKVDAKDNVTDTDTWQQIKVGKKKYYVPTYDDFYDLYKNCDFGFGIVYTDAATSPQSNCARAFGYAAQYKSGTDAYGMRGLLAYSHDTKNILVFPLSKSGYGRRRQFIAEQSERGYLVYGDVDYLLTNIVNNKSTNNEYRPIPYDLVNAPGALYWIDKVKMGGHLEKGVGYPSAAFDINYQTVDFTPYTANVLTSHSTLDRGSDAIPIRLVTSHTTKRFTPGE